MPIAILRAELLIPHARSLKQKRSPLKSLKERLRQRLGASVAEVDHQGAYVRAAIEVALAGRDPATTEDLLRKAEEMIRGSRETEVVSIRTDVVHAEEAPEDWP